jgi:hypothetical protein
VNAGFYICVHLARNTWIKISVIVILASIKFQKKCSPSFKKTPTTKITTHTYNQNQLLRSCVPKNMQR